MEEIEVKRSRFFDNWQLLVYLLASNWVMGGVEVLLYSLLDINYTPEKSIFYWVVLSFAYFKVKKSQHSPGAKLILLILIAFGARVFLWVTAIALYYFFYL